MSNAFAHAWELISVSSNYWFFPRSEHSESDKPGQHPGLVVLYGTSSYFAYSKMLGHAALGVADV